MTPGGDEVNALIQEAEVKLAAAKQAGGGKAGSLPVYLLLGEAGSAKTSVMLHSGLEPELLAGQVYQGGNVAPTTSANVWFSRGSLFIEAGGPLAADSFQWARLIKRLQPRGTMPGGGTAPRVAVVFLDSEIFTKPNAQDLAANIARNLRTRLGEMSQAMGLNLPVYVLFSRMDRVPFFAEFVRNLTNDEAGQILGVTLPITGRRSEGAYAEQEAARLSGEFERLFRSVADARPEYLPREQDPAKLPSAYEFPREFRKLRTLTSQFLVELCRPSQLTVSPFLRGFYFTGVRPVVINDAAAPVRSGPASGIFGGAPAAAPAPGGRKVPQWVFVTQLFQMMLADKAALGAGGSSSKAGGMKRVLYVAAAALCLLAAIAITISFFNNRGIESRVHEAKVKLGADEVKSIDVASTDSLRRLDGLRQELEILGKYKREGAPIPYRMGLYVGNDVYPEARRVYFDRFRQLLFGQTQDGILTNLRTLPLAPGPDYGPTYDALKAYLITTSNHDKSTKSFLSPVLMRWWTTNRTVDQEKQQLAQKQFDFYAEELREANPYTDENDAIGVQRARRYLAQFNGAERVYAFMLAEANKSNPPINFNRQFPGSEQTVVETHEVAGAFSRGGWTFMKDAVAHADRYFGGEPWVLGDQAGGNIDRARLEQDVKARYFGDFVKEWRAYIKGANVVRYAGLKDAAQKLSTIAGDQSTLLQLFALASQNTAVDDPSVASVFQPVQAVVPPGSLVAAPNQDYLGSLKRLQTSIGSIASQSVPSEGAASQTLGQATQAHGTVRQMAGVFRADPEGHIEGNVQKLLEDPIIYAEALLRTLGPGELNAKGRVLCGQFRSVMAKYPFNPNATPEASVNEVNGLFRKPDGALWNFYDQNLQQLLVKDGLEYVPHSAKGVTLTGPFVTFFKEAARFSEVLYAGGAQDPHFSYTLKPQPSEGIQSTGARIDGQQVSYTTGGPAQPVRFTWKGSGSHEANATVKFGGGPDLTWSSDEGVWAAFRFFQKAEKWTLVGSAQSLEWIVRVGKGPVKLPSGNPLTVRFDLEMVAAPPLFQRGYFSHLTCVSDVAR
jgi:type VI secretion system protein ImpL